MNALRASLFFLCLCAGDVLADELKIGLIGPVSGQWSAIGQRIVNGATLALEEHNTQSSLKVKLLVQDSRFDGKTAISAFRKLSDFDHIDALITADSISIDVIHPLIKGQPLPVVQLAEMGSEPIADNVFQVSEEFALCGSAIADAMNSKQTKDALVIQADIRAYQRVYASFAGTARFPFSRIVIDPADVDLRSIVTRVLRQNPSALVLMMGPEQSGAIMKEYRLVHKRPTPVYFEEDLMISLDAFQTKVPDLKAIENDFIGMIDRFTDADFISRYRKRFGEAPEYAEYGYDAMLVLLKTWHEDPLQWQKNLQASKLRGVTGDISFDRRGVRLGRTTVVTVREALDRRARLASEKQ